MEEKGCDTPPPREKVALRISQKSETIGKLAEALSKAQGAMTGAVKSKKNPFFKSRYSDLAACWDAGRAPLSENGLAVIQTTFVLDATTYLVTMLAHSSGEWVRGTLPVRPVKNDPQGMGSAITYARRQGFSAVVGVAPVDEDDDAEDAMGRQSDDPPKRNAPKPKPDPENQRINEEQRKKLFSFLDDHGLSHQALRGVLKGELRVDSTQDVKVGDLPKLTKALAGLAEENAKAVDEVFPKGEGE